MFRLNNFCQIYILTLIVNTKHSFTSYFEFLYVYYIDKGFKLKILHDNIEVSKVEYKEQTDTEKFLANFLREKREECYKFYSKDICYALYPDI